MEKSRTLIAVLFLTALLAGLALPAFSQAGNHHTKPGKKDTILLESLMQKRTDLFADILNKRQSLNVQIIYTRIDRDRRGRPTFTDHFFNVDTANYFYPASTVKLPVALLALQRLNELNIQGLDKYSRMKIGAVGNVQTPVDTDSSSSNAAPSVAHYIKKILLVSDNDAYNRLYEFLGQQYINDELHKRGYSSAQIIHRLEVFLSEADNRHTNPITFFDAAGAEIYKQEALISRMNYVQRHTKLGNGFYRGGQLVNEPFDFSKKNRFDLTDMHKIIRAVMFPESIPARERFNLTKDDYDFLRKYMSMVPRESDFPAYAQTEYWDTYVKFAYYGAAKDQLVNTVRSFNKPGDAYGFMIDAAYIADFKNAIEFLVSAVIYCNSDGILNDDKYDYTSVGYPFMKNLGRMIYDYELTRTRKYKPDLSSFTYDYRVHIK